MSAHRLDALATHVCADTTTSGILRRWPPPMVSPDTLQRRRRICEHAGIAEQQVLRGKSATAEALLAALRRARAALGDEGVLVLTVLRPHRARRRPDRVGALVPGRRRRELSRICEHLAALPAAATLLLICDTRHAAAIAQALCGPQQAVVLASCGDGQTMLDRRRSEFVVRIEDFLCATRGRGSLAALRAQLEADTPDCERPVVWTHAAHRWLTPGARYLPARSAGHAGRE